VSEVEYRIGLHSTLEICH